MVFHLHLSNGTPIPSSSDNPSIFSQVVISTDSIMESYTMNIAASVDVSLPTNELTVSSPNNPHIHSVTVGFQNRDYSSTQLYPSFSNSILENQYSLVSSFTTQSINSNRLYSTIDMSSPLPSADNHLFPIFTDLTSQLKISSDVHSPTSAISDDFATPFSTEKNKEISSSFSQIYKHSASADEDTFSWELVYSSPSGNRITSSQDEVEAQISVYYPTYSTFIEPSVSGRSTEHSIESMCGQVFSSRTHHHSVTTPSVSAHITSSPVNRLESQVSSLHSSSELFSTDAFVIKTLYETEADKIPANTYSPTSLDSEQQLTFSLESHTDSLHPETTDDSVYTMSVLRSENLAADSSSVADNIASSLPPTGQTTKKTTFPTVQEGTTSSPSANNTDSKYCDTV